MPNGQPVSLPTAEDVIIAKLRWAQLAGRGKDREDVRDVIAVQDVEGTLDWPYLRQWCERHGTQQLLDEIRTTLDALCGKSDQS